MTDTETFISSELNYFQPMITRESRSSPQQRTEWRLETIRDRQRRISLEVYELLDHKVNYGPFKGLILDKDRWWGALDLGSQCLGLYELEFLNVINKIQPNEFSLFIDIGAADGYYAVGMLHSERVKHCICFEQSDLGRASIRNNWKTNGEKGTLEIFSEATTSSLLKLTDQDIGRALVMIDIEGAEFDLLTLSVLERLKTSTILIEIHNWIDNFSEKYAYFLKNAFALFNVNILPRIDRNTYQFPELRDFTDDNRALLVSERRPCLMRFLMLTPKYSC